MVKEKRTVLAKKAKTTKGIKKHACTFPGCPVICVTPAALKIHFRVHSGEKPFACEHPGCDSTFTQKGQLKLHLMIHTGEKPHECDFPHCGKCFINRSRLRRHKLKHTDEKPHPCTFPGCDFSARTHENLKNHMRTHKEGKPFACDFPGCEFTTKHPGQIKKHKVIHTGNKPHACDFPGCGFSSAYLKSLKHHKMTHIGVKPHSCDFPGCDFSSVSSSNLKIHRRLHTGEKPYSCPHPGCNYRAVGMRYIRSHMLTHIPGAQRVRYKKQELRVTKMLTEWNYLYDCEVTINAFRLNCVVDTQRHFSRLDYVIPSCVNAILILEVDENAHFWYNLSCELSRMADIRCALETANITLPIYWIRYNPNGTYHVGGENVFIRRADREVALKAKLDELCSPDYVPENQVNIHYMYYDLMSKESGPEIMFDQDFPEMMREVVSWNP